MHPVDGDELLREGVGYAELVRVRSGDPTDELALAEPSEKPVDPFGREAPPIGPKRDLERGMAEDGGGPLDGMDLGQQRSVDQPGPVEQLLVGPSGVFGAKPVAD